MNNPTYLVTHHGADARKLTLAEMRSIYQTTHYNSLYKKYDQPKGNDGMFPDIAYHILVGTDGWEVARNFDVEGYHASNYAVNLDSLAIVLTGNYDRDTLSHEMWGYYKEAVKYARKTCPSLIKPRTHRTYANKSCPGRNITEEFVRTTFNEAGQWLLIDKLRLLIKYLTRRGV